MKLSIVVPCFNEEETILETAKRLQEVLSELKKSNKISHESFILFVDDGSSDSTWKIIEMLDKDISNIYGLKLSRNRGHQNALFSGLMKARVFADAAVSIDADLQDDPEAIVNMVDHFLAGSDVVYGVRDCRKTDTFFKKHTAQLFYKAMK